MSAFRDQDLRAMVAEPQVSVWYKHVGFVASSLAWWDVMHGQPIAQQHARYSCCSAVLASMALSRFCADLVLLDFTLNECTAVVDKLYVYGGGLTLPRRFTGKFVMVFLRPPSPTPPVLALAACESTAVQAAVSEPFPPLSFIFFEAREAKNTEHKGYSRATAAIFN